MFHGQTIESHAPLIMDPVLVAVVILALTNAVSEILPYTPLKGNGIVQLVIEFLKKYSNSQLPPK